MACTEPRGLWTSYQSAFLTTHVVKSENKSGKRNSNQRSTDRTMEPQVAAMQASVPVQNECEKIVKFRLDFAAGILIALL